MEVRMDWSEVEGLISAKKLKDEAVEDFLKTFNQLEVDEIESVDNLHSLVKLLQRILQFKDDQMESLMSKWRGLKGLKGHEAGGNDIVKAEDKDQNDFDVKESDDYKISLKIKNDKIKILSNEVERLENENISMKNVIEKLKEEMEKTTDCMNEMAEALTNLNNQKEVSNTLVEKLKQENGNLTGKIGEMKRQLLKREKSIEEFSAAMDVRILEWQNILSKKNAEISQLKDQLLVNSPKDSSKLAHLIEKIDKKNEIIAELESKLLEAISDINEGANIIEQLKSDIKMMEKRGVKSGDRDLTEIQKANEKICKLQLALNESERNLKKKSQQCYETLSLLRKYENKNGGLTETISELMKIKRQIHLKNNHIQDLIRVVNKLESVNSSYQMEIFTLRNKLGIGVDETVPIDPEVAYKFKEQIDINDNEVIHGEYQQETSYHLKSDDSQSRLSDADQTEQLENEAGKTDDSNEFVNSPQQLQVQRTLKLVIEENEALRKGMHEILDSIHDQDGNSEVKIHSDSLERLLEALDTRHLAGWYHPAMRLQERINVIQGSNSELRSQLRQLRKEMKRDKLLIKSLKLEDQKEQKIAVNVEETAEEEIKEVTKDLGTKLTSELENTLEHLQQEKNLLLAKVRDLKVVNEEMRVQLEVFKTDIEVLINNPEESDLKKLLANRSKECSDLAIDLIISNRKCLTLEELLTKESQNNYHNEKVVVFNEQKYKRLLVDTQSKIKTMESKVEDLEKNLLNSISIFEYNKLKDEYSKCLIELRVFYELKSAPSFNDSNDRLETISNNQCDDIKNYKNLDKINSELREQLFQIQNHLLDKLQPIPAKRRKDRLSSTDLEEEMKTLKVENENLMKKLSLSQEEAQLYYTINSSKILEVDNLRHQILDLLAISEDKETIAKLGFELNNCRLAEMEMSKCNFKLKNDLKEVTEELEMVREKYDDVKTKLTDFQRYFSIKSSNYEEIILFLQSHYCGSTTLTSLKRCESLLNDLREGKRKVNEDLKEVNVSNEKIRMQQDILASRLKVVDDLIEILEEKIGSSEVRNLISYFSDVSKTNYNEYLYRKRISQLESDLELVMNKSGQYESVIRNMEDEIINMQKVWSRRQPAVSNVDLSTNEIAIQRTFTSNFTQTELVNVRSVEVQSDLDSKVVNDHSETVSNDRRNIPNDLEDTKDAELQEKLTFLQDQLKQALELAADRSKILIKCESQITEYKAKISELSKSILEKDSKLMEQKQLNEFSNEKSEIEEPEKMIGADKIALQSTVNSLEKIVEQKEESIARYKNLLKEDRDECNKIIERLQDEVKALKSEAVGLKVQLEQFKSKDALNLPDKSSKLNNDRPDVDADEKIVRLKGEIFNLEAELNISKELGQRWCQLAEERLRNMDEMRERLESQHKSELDVYKNEINKWQSETSALREELSSSRVKLDIKSITVSKELQERDKMIEQLSSAYQQLESDVEGAMSDRKTGAEFGENASEAGSSGANFIGVTKNSNFVIQKLTSELQSLQQHLRSAVDNERGLKEEVGKLKQQLNEKIRMSRREEQLERKLKIIEDELNRCKMLLNKEQNVQQQKRIKTAQELMLWEKQKKWQQIAEKLKNQLKDKDNEMKKLNSSMEKSKLLISCIEREKWFLRDKLSKSGLADQYSNSFMINSNKSDMKVIKDLHEECTILRNRLIELTERLENDNNNRNLLEQIEKQKIELAALRHVQNGNEFIVDKLKLLEDDKVQLEKANIKLESENFELKMKLEQLNNENPRLVEKIQHLEKYISLLKSTDSNLKKINTSKQFVSFENDDEDDKKSVAELEKTIFVLKKIIDKLQNENKKLKTNSSSAKNDVNLMKNHFNSNLSRKSPNFSGVDVNKLKKQYEMSQKRVIQLESDLQIAEERIKILENNQDEEVLEQIHSLKQQLTHKSQLLDKVKQLLTRAAINEKALRHQIQQFELKQTLSPIPEIYSN